jgi:hypothetical protein
MTLSSVSAVCSLAARTLDDLSFSNVRKKIQIATVGPHNHRSLQGNNHCNQGNHMLSLQITMALTTTKV